MSDIFDRRLRNLRQLSEKFGGTAALAEALGLSKGRISQLIGARPSASISEKLARSFEEGLGLQHGWLDQETGEVTESNPIRNTPEPQRWADDASKILRLNLLKILEEHGLSQSELARRANMQPKSINRLLDATDSAPSPTLDTLQSLANGLKTSVAELLSPDFIVPKPSPAEITIRPRVATSIGRLIEDFLLCSAEDRQALLEAANTAAERNNSKSSASLD